MQFDETRGYGFITPDEGGDDVFLHVNVLGNDRWTIAPGVPVEFESIDSGRGPKAMSVRVLASVAAPAEGGPVSGPVPRPAPVAVAPVAPVAAVAPRSDDEDVLCDVLPEQVLLAELTEAFLASAPDLTAGQILVLRREMLALARRHSWVED